MSQTTVLFTSSGPVPPAGFTAHGPCASLAEFRHNHRVSGNTKTPPCIIRPRTADGFLLLDDPRHSGGTRQVAGATFGNPKPSIDHNNGFETKASDGAWLDWDNVSIAAGEMINFDYIFIDGEEERLPHDTYNDFWQFEALSAASGQNVLGYKTQCHSLDKGNCGSRVDKKGIYIWRSFKHLFEDDFRGRLRWTVGNGQRVKKDTGLNSAANKYPSALALDFVSIT